METDTVEKISRSIHRQFPEFTGTKPKVRVQAAPKASNSSNAQTYLLTFESQVPTTGGKNLTRWVRVIATQEGKILKITTSR